MEKARFPFWYMVYKVLREKGRAMTDRELFELLRSRDPSVSIADIERALMKLEINGKAMVYEARKGTLTIELTEKIRYIAPDEE